MIARLVGKSTFTYSIAILTGATFVAIPAPPIAVQGFRVGHFPPAVRALIDLPALFLVPPLVIGGQGEIALAISSGFASILGVLPRFIGVTFSLTS